MTAKGKDHIHCRGEKLLWLSQLSTVGLLFDAGKSFHSGRGRGKRAMGNKEIVSLTKYRQKRKKKKE